MTLAMARARAQDVLDDRLLALLRNRPHHAWSQEELAERLRCRAAAIRPALVRLEEAGYVFERSATQGWRFGAAPDRLIPLEIRWHLRTKRFGARIHAFASTGSTMDAAHRLARAGAPEGTLVVAESQTHGRGRAGRSWVSPPGQGIYASLILRPRVVAAQIHQMTLLAAVVAAQTIEQTTRLEPSIRWPNDLLLKERKVGGILTESAMERGSVGYVIVGMGLNVNGSRAELPEVATSLAIASHHAVDRLQVLRVLLQTWERWYERWKAQGFDPVHRAFAQRCVTLGRMVRVRMRGAARVGQAEEIDEDGGLVIRWESGLEEVVRAGDVELLQ